MEKKYIKSIYPGKVPLVPSFREALMNKHRDGGPEELYLKLLEEINKEIADGDKTVQRL